MYLDMFATCCVKALNTGRERTRERKGNNMVGAAASKLSINYGDCDTAAGIGYTMIYYSMV
jgi:hypothetical protein